MSLSIAPVLRGNAGPVWDGSVWIGEIWLADVGSGVSGRCRLLESDGYRTARLLVRAPGTTFGFIDVAVTDGEVDLAELQRAVAARVASCGDQAEPTWVSSKRRPSRSVTVVICTRDRPAMLRDALRSVLNQYFRTFEVIVVDNAAATAETREHVLGLSDPRVRLIVEPRPGLSRARNAGLLAATGDIVAFIDDDVVVDRRWLGSLLDGFHRAESVTCVSGIVPAGEIRTRAQHDFDRRVSWASSSVVRVFDWNSRPADIPLFPFAVGEYGTGANFAVDRDTALQLGGFDENLGAGSPCCGGEDIDMFFRVLQSGGRLVHEPAAVVWHRHRDNNEALFAQMRGYAVGLGAWLAKILGDRSTARLAVTTALRQIPALTRHNRALSQQLPLTLVLRGAWTYQRARRARPFVGLTGQDPPVQHRVVNG